MNKKKLVKEFTSALEEMKRTKSNGTYYWKLDNDDNNNVWAIVLGWNDGFDEDETDDCMDGTYRLCTKLAYQSSNNIMKEYDIDWLMPYDEKTGEVDDTEVSIYPDTNIEEAIEWQLDFGNHSYSYGELNEFQYYFERLAKRYGLVKEFRENGII